jgi:hypothetical protein
LRGLPARGRSVTFPVWRKRCIGRTMMEWLTLKWSATLLWLRPPLCMPTACHLSGMVNFRRTIRRLPHQGMRARRPIKRPQLTLRHRHARFDWSHAHLAWTIRTRRFARSTCTWTVSNISRLTKTLHQSYNDGMVNPEVVCRPSMAKTTVNLFQVGLLFSLLGHTYLLTCETGYWSICIYMYMTGCVKCHVYFSTFVFPNESWFFLCSFCQTVYKLYMFFVIALKTLTSFL